MSHLTLYDLKINKACLILKALAHPLRYEILQFIHRQKAVAVNEIYRSLGQEQSITSQHLAILRKAGFVTTLREGKRIYYSVNYDRINEVQREVNVFLS